MEVSFCSLKVNGNSPQVFSHNAEFTDNFLGSDFLVRDF